MSTEIELYNSTESYDLLKTKAADIAETDFAAGVYRGNVLNVVVAAMAGAPYGWTPFQSCQNFHVIKGSPAMKPVAMLGLIRSRGHLVTIERPDQISSAAEAWCRVTGQRGDTGEEQTVTWSMADAERANVARPGSGWETYPMDMCQWRAISVLARGLFSDLLIGGVSHTVDEIGADISPDGEVIEARAAVVPSAPPPESAQPEPRVLPPKDLTLLSSNVKKEMIETVGSTLGAKEVWMNFFGGLNPKEVTQPEYVTLMAMCIDAESDNNKEDEATDA